jgi:hypothetical protein
MEAGSHLPQPRADHHAWPVVSPGTLWRFVEHDAFYTKAQRAIQQGPGRFKSWFRPHDMNIIRRPQSDNEARRSVSNAERNETGAAQCHIRASANTRYPRTPKATT